ncbi:MULTISPECIES: S41 family peptidase [Acinetobacter]|uniref:S41 family peptidase n=1 Tax=Acinetobacter haemolyticus TaxID=29430 RepID=A0A372MMA7_ACIHA|nr:MULTISPECIES: S41 family peptidase [Acinetobacter]EEH69915.1 peptidase, S41 family [Acinetobacter sp. ATCC 27244]MBO3658999.1 S41 family peptidase [Acinetobacter haemolyticus]MCU4378110.1 S41 family peptidase [Acinetobacter haemolyticus]NAR35509.1 S41 family peptidase [Acinetobacter haemolyticus]NAR47274.1 S41 family peptidase [Acinetobacter haemolyticus]
MTPRNNIYRAVFASLLLCWGHTLVAAPLSGWGENPPSRSAEVPIESIQQFVQIYGIVRDNYVEKKSDDALFQQSIKGLVSGLDPYSRYLSAEEYRQLIQYTEGDLASVDFNLGFDQHSKLWKVQDLKTGSDSNKLGLKNGQAILKIDNQELKSLNQDQVQGLLYGSIGSTVQILPENTTSTVILVRNKKVETDIEPVLLSNQVLVLKVKVFQQDTANEIKRLIEEFGSPRLKAVVLDLRNNPGGLLSAAVESADLFLNQGLIVTTKSRSEGDQQFQALPSKEFQNLKLGVLINRRSASAAEVFAAALKEHKRAWVVGETSYGKGVVQKLFPLPNGAALQMTVSHYYTPNGLMIEGQGIQPNQSYALQPEMKEEYYLDHISDLVLKSRL